MVVVTCTECDRSFSLSQGDRQMSTRLGLPVPRRCRECRAVLQAALEDYELDERLSRMRAVRSGAPAAIAAVSEAGVAPADSPAKRVGLVGRLRGIFAPAADA